ncbi:DUF3352 domain-containing protein [Nocardioides sp. T2.26MG-1]|uniref:DUF3352 domain-containing protein n=1 Tax=Nocardioides sp. T2.26MG-1 TaxID=3041166 RepID=UPI002477B33C|nr:DUF3352 domain-containing protein [Nocardioides sp. T2.26MG-1]CAI9419800.1 hypothetical protein HIDPHFAB_03874 [Nocardioides sp. T2.26MG-1]
MDDRSANDAWGILVTNSPEYLESGSGRPIPPPSGPSGGGGGRRTALIAVGSVVVLAGIGAGAWAAWSFFATGPQPAEALPASTVVYASIDLDPSGGQKIEALRTLRKFPAFKDHIGLETDDDIRQRIFEEIQGTGACEDLDYGDDVEPWLGDRMAVAAVDTGEDTPSPVFVLQVTDEDRADQGMAKIKECSADGDGGDGSAEGAWTIHDGWALLGETQEIVDGIADDAADTSLSDDEEYQSWTDAAGDAGIATFYVAPEAGKLFADSLNGLMPLTQGLDEAVPGPTGELAPLTPTEVTTALEDFQGMAATVRFDDGSLELELAADPGTSQDALKDADRGGDVLATLPEDTAAAIGIGFADGWFGDLMDQVSSQVGGMSADELLDELSAESGLDLPDDVETMMGDSAALALGSDFDLETFVNSADGSGVPVGLKVQGDPDAIESVLDKLRPQMGGAESALGSDSDGDVIAIGPDGDYRERLLDDGGLGDSDVFDNVVREADDAAAVVFVNFDAGDWLAGLAEDDPEVADNLEPLEGLGVSAWLEDGVSHAVLRVTTD